MLFDPAAHEPIAAEPWDEQRVRAAVREIVAEAERTGDPVSGWPLHPLDSDGDDDHAWVSHGVYLGVAGVLWAFHHLAHAGAVEVSIDLERAADELYESYRAACRLPGEPVPSLWLGEAGIHLVAEVISPDSARHPALLASVRANAHNETLEFLWGASGTMLAAREMHRRTGDERWAAAWSESADALWDAWRVDERLGCSLWTQDLYGRSEPLLGAGHGFAGNVFALLDGLELLVPERRDELVRPCGGHDGRDGGDRERPRELVAGRRRRSRPRWDDEGTVVSWRAGHGVLAGRAALTAGARRSPHRRCRAHMGGRAARQGPGALSRHGG